MLGRTLVTHQTGPAGKQVNRIYIEDGSASKQNSTLRCWLIASNSRVSFRLLDRRRHGHRRGRGLHARKNPVSFSVDPATGYKPFHGRRIAFSLGLEGKRRSSNASS